MQPFQCVHVAKKSIELRADDEGSFMISVSAEKKDSANPARSLL